MATWDPSQLPDLPFDEPMMAHELGSSMDEPMPDAWTIRWDKRETIRPDEFCDLGWGGEDQDGIFLRVHPHALLISAPEAWDVVSEWHTGSLVKAARSDLRLSNWDAEALAILRSAHAREKLRQTKAAYDKKS